MELPSGLSVSVTRPAANLTFNKTKVLRYTHIAQVLTGLFLLLFGYFIGKEHLHLILAGVRAPGVVVEYQPEIFRDSRSNSTSTGFMPVVQFEAGARTVRFKDWMGSHSSGILWRPVTVLYDPTKPTTAMIDRAIMNWIPWGPTMGVGLFLMLVGAGGYVRLSRQAETSSQQV